MEFDDIQTVGVVVLLGFLMFMSLDFEKHYAPYIHESARHPFMRFLAGMAIVMLATLNPIHSVLALMIVFFWIADVNLLSSIKL
jgi:hypothetical protein